MIPYVVFGCCKNSSSKKVISVAENIKITEEICKRNELRLKQNKAKTKYGSQMSVVTAHVLNILILVISVTHLSSVR